MEANIRLEERLAMFLDVPANFGKLRLPEAEIRGELDWCKPELRFAIVTTDVNVRRLASFPAVKMETVRPDAQHRWHAAIVPAKAVQSIHS
jgi:hypothetical protein